MAVTQIRAKRNEVRFTPSQRVVRAVRRISRDRWLDYWTVNELTHQLSKAVCFEAWGKVRAAAERHVGADVFVGLLNGRPPISKYSYGYSDLCKKLKNMKTRKDSIEPELAILDHYIRYGNGK